MNVFVTAYVAYLWISKHNSLYTCDINSNENDGLIFSEQTHTLHHHQHHRFYVCTLSKDSSFLIQVPFPYTDTPPTYSFCFLFIFHFFFCVKEKSLFFIHNTASSIHPSIYPSSHVWALQFFLHSFIHSLSTRWWGTLSTTRQKWKIRGKLMLRCFSKSYKHVICCSRV